MKYISELPEEENIRSCGFIRCGNLNEAIVQVLDLNGYDAPMVVNLQCGGRVCRKLCPQSLYSLPPDVIMVPESYNEIRILHNFAIVLRRNTQIATILPRFPPIVFNVTFNPILLTFIGTIHIPYYVKQRFGVFLITMIIQEIVSVGRHRAYQAPGASIPSFVSFI